MLTGTVLIIEVDPDITRNLAAILRSKGIATVVVGKVEPLATEAFPEDCPELIVLQAPREDPRVSAVLRAVKKNPRLSQVPVLAIGSPTLH